MPQRVLDVRNLSTHFFTEDGAVKSVDQVSFYINAEETLCVVGESGCGKSVTSLSIMQLIPSPPGKIVGGEILFNGEDLLKKSPEEMRKIRGNDIAMIFQEPMTSLNPVYTVGDQIAEAVILHQKVDKKEAWKRAVDMLREVGIPSPEKRAREYPHQMSGGMRQRVMIAMAMSCNPQLLIADEPTTALDVTIQAQILDLMRKLKREFHTAIMLITHDLGVVAEMADRVVVMYAGKIVEESATAELFREPLHPYTQGLLDSIPRLDQPTTEKLHVIEGTVPNPLHLPKGCTFAPRCPKAMDICREKAPVLTEVSEGRKVSCWLHVDPQKQPSGKEAAS
ncbi:ABC transporter ATP-binding protein [Sulfobacillus thermosulfidooxidans]|uniref:Oligopeptide transport system ATP-binding protein n=2 Tax=Sulfobacillus thermosulfidooxidans TaxID=28034 RepID=A0A1W1WHL0_SULTA|nr:ABC transporter ATP-binding protein [Sulfobacillus thermosulfidooxidans]OLZ09962.1 peptide ABC transporter ATP-binding protein [Sulfobacillus thermosulfidooxidans]OLZ15733.1 peptide ABC transporter ATP-binding protein [Sulfobacillus thermosulfidooxidans]OLZ18420.1 peptide ABC transporter ATP-binding protein [Sulfobacillus thermosulfidooxidans]PSR28227.1 MAG: ABC transporter ATP-binding protein [Sulfobacillus thermosulfidooxidans]SMC05520.1 oligopeptide transport system ATP-binding protein [